MKRQLKRSNEVILVASSLYNTTDATAKILSSTATTTPVIDTMATGALAFGEADVNKTSYNQVVTAATVTSDKKRKLEIFNKVAYTGLKYPLKNIKFFSSILDAEFPIQANIERYKAPSISVWSVKTPAVLFEPNTVYQLETRFKNRTIDEVYSTEGLLYTTSVTTPDYPSSVANANVQNYVLGKMAIDINSSSPLNAPQYRGQIPMIALGVVATASSLVGTAFSALTAGTPATLNVWNSKKGMKTATLNGNDVTSLKKAVTSGSFLASDKIVPLDITKISDLTLAAADCLKGIILIGLERETVWEDFVAQVQANIDNVGVSKGFDPNQVACVKESDATENNSTRALWLQYRNTFSQRLYNKIWDERANIVYPNPIDLSKNYCVLSIEHSNEHSSDLGHLTIDPFKTLILAEDTQPGAALSTSSPTMTNIIAILDAFLAVNNQGATTV